LLVRVVEAPQPRSIGELSTRAGLPKSTTSRLVGALERQGLVERLGARGRLRPGPVLLRYASRDASQALVALAQPSLRRLADESGETINLAVPGPEGVEHLAQEDTAHLVGVTDWVGRRVTHEEILQGLYDNTLIGNAPEVKDLVNQGLEDELEPEKMLYDALIPSLEEVGTRFERGDFFVPEMLIAARAMQGALDILRPLLAETGARQIGTYVMRTVKGDVHDIGKNLVNIMLDGPGLTVHDLGVNVAP